MPESLFSGLVAVRSFLSLIGTAASLLSQQEDARTIVPKIGESREPEKRNLVRKKVKQVSLVGQQGKALKSKDFR